MEAVNLRPKLVSFRATSFHGENKDASGGRKQWKLQLTQTIEVALAVADANAAPLQAIVKIDLVAKAVQEDAPDQTADFSAAYEAKFAYPPEATEAEIAPEFEREPYQYVLVAQAFPLAMTHFRREMQAMGFDARELPLGI
ncbi:hypothetical protein [Ramlibacter sp. WS9]|uniref:hypothetical protein n=1 Tax=Ramlibacter sp. WS9 TaxID=1882741 RepID=UPI001143A166|nr:hypothetical protein [Ramlibacter sp. WS9]ROZ62134.1 hypothetical protein EEB15_31500 [Ramlibacter sp. WS9]